MTYRNLLLEICECYVKQIKAKQKFLKKSFFLKKKNIMDDPESSNIDEDEG